MSLLYPIPAVTTRELGYTPIRAGQDRLCLEEYPAIKREEKFVRGHRRKCKGDKAMASAHPSPEDIRQIRELAAQWGKIVARRAFGPQGPGLDVNLSAMEKLALEVSRGLVEGTLGTLLEQQAQALGAEHPCPTCNRPCPVQREPRTLRLAGGHQAHANEPVCHCPDCRRDFFPPAAGAASGQPQLQPDRAADDR